MIYADNQGQLVPNETLAGLHLNRAFRYGDGLFETVKVIDGKPLHFALHIERLNKGMAVLGLELDSSLSYHAMLDRVTKLLEKNKVTGGGRIRMAVFRVGPGGYKPEHAKVSSMLVFEESANEYAHQAQGVALGVYTEHCKYANGLSHLKSSNALLYVLAAKWAGGHGFDDVLLLNDSGRICEATASNLFLVKGNTILTPNLQEGCVAGVMRKVVIDLAIKAGLNVREGKVEKEDLLQADEVFLTNAMRGVQWVSGYQKKRYFQRVSRALQKRLV